jgi:putative addiction module killer protein
VIELRRYQRADGREPFSEWLTTLRDKTAAARIRIRLRQVEADNFGDCEPVGEGVIELCVHIGPGYRIYCGRYGRAIVILICGGDKSTQARDIKRAKELWAEWKERQS